LHMSILPAILIRLLASGTETVMVVVALDLDLALDLALDPTTY